MGFGLAAFVAVLSVLLGGKASYWQLMITIAVCNGVLLYRPLQ
jgi:hypothetical protein